MVQLMLYNFCRSENCNVVNAKQSDFCTFTTCNPNATVVAQVAPYESAPPYMGCCPASGPGYQFAVKSSVDSVFTCSLGNELDLVRGEAAGSGSSMGTGHQFAAELGTDSCVCLTAVRSCNWSAVKLKSGRPLI